MLEPQVMPRVSRAAIAAVEDAPRRAALLGAAALLIGAAAYVHIRAVEPGPDVVDVAEAARRAAALTALGPLKLNAVAAGDLAAVLAASGLPAADRDALAGDVAASRVRMVHVLIFDSDVEDGDVAEIRSGAFRQTVHLTTAPVLIGVPVGPDNAIEVAGLVDGGGGGVTVGLVLPSGPIPLPPLSVGQILRLRIGWPH